MNQKEAYEHGVDVGYDIARSNLYDYKLDTEEQREKFVSEMFETESENFRQYSPFEFFANEINETGDRAEGIWDKYDAGVGVGIRKALREALHELKG